MSRATKKSLGSIVVYQEGVPVKYKVVDVTELSKHRIRVEYILGGNEMKNCILISYVCAGRTIGAFWKTVWKWANQDNILSVYKYGKKGFVSETEVQNVGYINRINEVVELLGISRRTLYNWAAWNYEPYDEFHFDRTPGGGLYVNNKMLEVAKELNDGIEERLEKCNLPRFRI